MASKKPMVEAAAPASDKQKALETCMAQIERTYGKGSIMRLVENKVAPPFKEAEFDIMYGEGISKVGELVDLGVKLDLLQKSGSWFAMGETRLGQGRDAVKQYLKENPEVAERIEADIRANAYKLMSSQARAAARAAGRAVDVSAEDFEDADQ